MPGRISTLKLSFDEGLHHQFTITPRALQQLYSARNSELHTCQGNFAISLPLEIQVS